MKIGIVSMQRIVNYGSFLQAYGLKRIIEELGHEVVFFDYKSKLPVTGFTVRKLLAHVVRKNPGLGWLEDELRSRERLHYRYHREFLPMLGVSYTHNPNETMDIAVVGSDEVFNCLQPTPDVGFSPTLFGQGIHAEKVISYAASFGYTTLEGLKKYGLIDELSKYLRDFSAISVRDENSRKVITYLVGQEPTMNLDPVLIYDYDLPEVDLPENYVILYTYLTRKYTDKERQQILSFCHQNGKILISIGEAQDWVDRKVDANPFELLAYFRNADFVITDTFHGALISMKYNKNFVCRLREDNRQKLGDLLQKLNQEKRMSTDYDNLQKYLDNPPDYTQTNLVIAKGKKEAVAYLSAHLQK